MFLRLAGREALFGTGLPFGRRAASDRPTIGRATPSCARIVSQTCRRAQAFSVATACWRGIAIAKALNEQRTASLATAGNTSTLRSVLGMDGLVFDEGLSVAHRIAVFVSPVADRNLFPLG